jgi:hypothetical protein
MLRIPQWKDVNSFYFAARIRVSAFQMAELLISSAISIAEENAGNQC